jgi:hypothetical protein
LSSYCTFNNAADATSPQDQEVVIKAYGHGVGHGRLTVTCSEVCYDGPGWEWECPYVIANGFCHEDAMASEHCCGCGGGNRGQVQHHADANSQSNGDEIQSHERGSEEIAGVTEVRLVPFYTVSGWAWDVQRVAFMTEEGELTREQGCEVFDSGNAGADIGYGPENAFSDSGAIWGGRQDDGGVFYIGLRCDSHHRIVSVDLQQPSDTHFAPEVVVEGRSNDGPFAGEWHMLGFEFAEPTPERVTLWSEGEEWADEQEWPTCDSHTCDHGMQLVMNPWEVYCHEWGCDDSTCCYQAASQTEGCADVAGWSDSEGDSCHSYVHNGWCHDPSNFEFTMNGHTADTACCACGGGLFHEEAGCAYHHESCEVIHDGCINNHEHADFVGMECDGDDHRATCQMLDGEFLCVRCGAERADEFLAQTGAATEKLEGDGTDLMQTHDTMKKKYATKSPCL